MPMSKIELLLRSRLIRDALSALLVEAGFSVLHEPNQDDYNSIVVIDFGDCKNQEVVRALKSQDAKIVVLADEAGSLKMSADDIVPLSGVLTRELSASAFVQSLRLIGSGERVFPRGLALGQSPPAPSPDTKSQFDGVHLSPREREVLSHVMEGHSNKIIAQHLGVTEATAKVHLTGVLRKIKVDNRTQAAIWALANLPELDPTPRGFV